MAGAYDVIVVGARCAGSPLATLLARAGLSVCVVDRATFPSDTPSTHAIQPTGVKVLERLGVLDPLLAVAPAIDGGRVQFDDVRLEVSGMTARVGAPMVNARRTTLDTILVDAAREAGAEVRTSTTVTGLVERDGRVAGVATTTEELRAPLVVGADGARSTVAGLVGAPEYHRTRPGRAFLWAYFEGADAPTDRVWLGKLGDHAFLACPTDGGQFLAAVVESMHRRDELRAGRERCFDDGLACWPELHDALAGARRVGPVRMMSRWHGFFRRSAGPGWALVGDAGHFKDPTPGQGIADALRQVEALAEAIVRGLGGAAPLDDALDAWWRWRDRDAWEMYWFAHDLGAPGPNPPILSEILRRIAADEKLTDRLVRVLNHDITPSQAFTAPLALAAAGTALARSRGDRRAVLHEARRLAGNQVRRALGRP